MLLSEIVRRSFWSLSAEDAINLLETSREGLSRREAEERLKTFGKNTLPEKSRVNWLMIFLRQFYNPLIILLLIAAGITFFVEHFKDAIFIFFAVVVNVVLGFYQESKAESALKHLQTYIRERAKVFRDGQKTEIDAAELAPGDIIHLSQGDRVPADCRLLYINDFLVDESVLTGESLPVNKKIEAVDFQSPIADQLSMVFSGTLVAQGFAHAIICRTGRATELGKIASEVAKSEHEATPLQKALLKFSITASIALITLTTFLFFGGLAAGKPIFEMFLTSVAITVSAVPEGLPVALTVILAIGVQRLAKKNGVVRKLLAAETLGSTSIILTDKTGTLTQAKMKLSHIETFGQKDTARIENLMLEIAALNSDTVIENPEAPASEWEISGRPMEVAVVKAAAERGILFPKLKKEFRLIDYLPFNSKNKYSVSFVHKNDKHFLAVLGAPEILLKHSALAGAAKEKMLLVMNEMAENGERLLGVGYKEIAEPGNDPLHHKKELGGLEFLGALAFRDPIRPNVKESILRVQKAGVRVLILTGDHRGTATAVAQEVGLEVLPDEVIEGAALEKMEDRELKKLLPQLKIIARVSPEDKFRVAKLFQELGEVVAMTGDGINDAASLKQADIGVAMGSGTDVAKDVSDLVLLDDNFATIVAAIEEGRRTLGNIRKVIVYLLSSVFGELILVGGSLATGIALPLSALQILWINFISDSFPAIALAFEDHVDYLSPKFKRLGEHLLDWEIKFLVFAIGLPTSALIFALYWLLLNLGYDPEIVRTFTFAAFTVYSLVLIFSVRSLRTPIYKYSFFSNPFLLACVAFGLGLIGLAVYHPFFQELFGTVTLPLNWLAAVAGVGFLNIAIIEGGKMLIHRNDPA